MNAVQLPPLRRFYAKLVGVWFTPQKGNGERNGEKESKSTENWARRQPLSLKMVTMETVPFSPLLWPIWSHTFLCNRGYKLAPSTTMLVFFYTALERSFGNWTWKKESTLGILSMLPWSYIQSMSRFPPFKNLCLVWWKQFCLWRSL